jgi:hypothetical protein
VDHLELVCEVQLALATDLGGMRYAQGSSTSAL